MYHHGDSDYEDECYHPNSRQMMNAEIYNRMEYEEDGDSAGLPVSCSTQTTKLVSGSKRNDTILMLLMIASVASAIFYMKTNGYAIELVQVAPSRTDQVTTDPSLDIIKALNATMATVEMVSSLNMQENHDLKSKLKLSIDGGQFETQHLVLQLLTSEVGNRAKVERAAGVDHVPKMQQGNLLRDAERK